MTAPRVTVVCPTHDRSTAILPTLRSVLAQTWPDLELVVVADGCTDDTEDVVRQVAREDARVRLLRTSHRHGHPAEPRNLGIAEARGDVVAYVDHDDVWEPGHLAALVRLLDDGAQVAASGYRYVRADGSEVSRATAAELFWHPEIQTLAPLFEPSRVAHRRAVVPDAGGWVPGHGLEDWDLWLRIADRGVDVRTVDSPSAVLLDHESTRRFRTARPYRMALASFDRPAGAQAFVTGLRTGRHTAELHEACVADTLAWYRRLRGEPRFHTPAGWAGDVEAAVLAALGDDHVGLWQDMVLLNRGRGLEVSVPLWCARPEHADRVRGLVARVHRRQLATLRRIAEEHGGTAAGVAVAPSTAAAAEVGAAT